MVTALIFAGGSGVRMNLSARPKQFLELDGKAVIIHTLEYFENHPEVDSICIVCIEPWIDYLKELLQKHEIQKVRWVARGGNSGQESISNGLEAIYESSSDPENTIVLIHDGVRPLINAEVISDNINSVKQFGSAVTVTPAVETIVTAETGNRIDSISDRSVCRLARAPQSFLLSDIYEAHQKAKKDGLLNIIDSASLMRHYGHPLYMVEGPVDNIKITTPIDFYLFRAIYEARESSQIFGI